MRWNVLSRAGAVVACAILAPPSLGELLYGVTEQGFLIRFDSSNPVSLQSSVPIIGLQPNEIVVGIDYRATDNNIYAMGSFGRTYILDKNTGAATFQGQFAGINGSNFGYDWNPVEDVFRLVSDTDQNFRVGPDGLFQNWDVAIAYAAGDVNGGIDPNIIDSAYSNSFAGATSTILFGIDASRDTLVRINPETGGVAETIGSLGLTINARGGFDISQSGIAYLGAMLEGESVSNLYSVNLATGATTLLGQIDSGIELRALTVIPVPAPGTAALALLGLGVMAKRRRN